MTGFDNGFEVLLPALAAAAGGQSAPGGTQALGFHQGVVLTWNALTGANTVQINGNTFTDLRSLLGPEAAMIRAGDSVGVLRYQTTYFVVGRISAAGGAQRSIGIDAAGAAAQVTTSSTSYVSLTGGPTLTNIYIGSRRKALVIVSSLIEIAGCVGYMAFDVSGASTIAANTANVSAAIHADGRDDITATTVTAVSVLSSGDGLNEGLNTFTAKYAFGAYGTPTFPGTLAAFTRRTITVFPL